MILADETKHGIVGGLCCSSRDVVTSGLDGWRLTVHLILPGTLQLILPRAVILYLLIKLITKIDQALCSTLVFWLVSRVIRLINIVHLHTLLNARTHPFGLEHIISINSLVVIMPAHLVEVLATVNVAVAATL